jgi:hypothetical protein
VRGGRASVLKRVLQHDLGAALPMVLVVSEVRTNAGRAGGGAAAGRGKPPGGRAPQQGEAPEQEHKGGGGGGGGGAAQVLGVQLSDGWYFVNACVDEPLAQLLLTGQLQVGSGHGAWLRLLAPIDA